MQFKYNRGGYTRGSGKYRGDCVPRAITIATGLPYEEVYEELQRRMEEMALFEKLLSGYRQNKIV